VKDFETAFSIIQRFIERNVWLSLLVAWLFGLLLGAIVFSTGKSFPAQPSQPGSRSTASVSAAPASASSGNAPAQSKKSD